ncbi:hypothetical protein ES703_29912 [subsurface metagenome]
MELLDNRKVQILLALLIITLATQIRIYDLGGRSLWLDEASVANWVSQRSLKEVWASMGPAPPLFVITVHYIVKLLPNNEFTLRLLACLFGIGSLVLIYLVARRIDSKAALLTLILFSFSAPLIYYSKELKQYSGDVFFALLLVFLSERIVTRDTLRNWGLWVVFSSLALCFSHAAVFVIPGFSLVLLLQGITSRRRNILPKWLLSNAVVGLVFLLIFYFVIRGQIQDRLVAYWRGSYPDTTSGTNLLLWLVKSNLMILKIFFQPNGWLALLLIPVAMGDFVRANRRRFLLYLLFPLFLALAASFLHRYPYGVTRLMLFATPMLFIAMGQGLFRVLVILYQKKYLIALLVMVILFTWPTISHIYAHFSKPVRKEEMRPVIQYLEKNLEPEDRIYVYYAAWPAFRYYYQGNYENVVRGKSHRDDINKYAPEMDEILERDIRVWLVFSHYWPVEREFCLNYLSKRGSLLTEQEAEGAVVYLYRIY